ncbi:MAG: ATP-binding region ATPase domain protein [Gemmatimonadetes bacterium]|jgi:signal transduction histidine kinase|nr:ATP-binding region ATPase domain protein [Gemmatimonadota bacterium]
MDLSAPCPLAGALALRLRSEKDALTRRWLDRISQRVALDPNRIFPTDELLDHVPLLIDGIATYLEYPAQTVSADMPVIAKAMELGALRYTQGFDEYELLKEYEIFGGILFAFLSRAVDEIDLDCSRQELVLCAHRLYHAISLIQQATTVQFLALMKERLSEREERLRAFNRSLTHEMRNRIGATMGAGQLLQMPELAATEQERLVGIIVRNMESMRVALDNLLELSRLSNDARQHRHVLLPRAAAEVVRQLRELARSRGVRVTVDDALPEVEVNAAGVELCLMNYVSNSLKYSDDDKADRWVQITGRMQPATSETPSQVIVEVRDTGLGVAPEKRSRLFERFYRAGGDATSGIDGTGLGLSIVRETVESLGGRAWAEFTDSETVFAFALPSRRAGERTPSSVPTVERESVI